MDELFNFVVLCSSHGGVDLERQRHRRVVQLFRADIHGARTLPDLDPVITEAVVRKDVYVASLSHGGASDEHLLQKTVL